MLIKPVIQEESASDMGLVAGVAGGVELLEQVAAWVHEMSISLCGLAHLSICTLLCPGIPKYLS